MKAIEQAEAGAAAATPAPSDRLITAPCGERKFFGQLTQMEKRAMCAEDPARFRQLHDEHEAHCIDLEARMVSAKNSDEYRAALVERMRIAGATKLER